MWNVEMEIIPAIKGGNWNRHKTVQKIPELHNWKARQQGTADNSHIGHCTHTSEGSNVQDKTYIARHNITCTIYCNNSIVGTLCTLQTWIVSLFRVCNLNTPCKG